MVETTLRQRKGKDQGKAAKKDHTNEELFSMFQEKMRSAMAEKVRSECAEDSTEKEIQAQIDENMAGLFGPKKKPLPGIKNETKAAKDALTADPYNIQKIFDCGEAYLLEEKYVEAANVMIRGWKRTGEIEKPEQRFVFLFQLCHASCACQKFKQAHAVLMDIEEPDDPDLFKDYCRLACKIYAQNDNLQKALKAFHNGLEKCASFDEALPLWLDTLSSLKKVGAYEAARSKVESMAVDDSDKQKLQVVETVRSMKAHLDEPVDESARTKVMIAVGSLALGVIVYCLYLLESSSLASLKLTK